MGTIALKARWVLPVAAPPVDGGVVSINGDRIVGVGTKPSEDAELRDLGDVVLLPGFVNAHTHLEFSDLAQPLGDPNCALPDWIRWVIANRKSQVSPSTAVCAGLEESVRAGVTTLGEIATSPVRLADDVKRPDVVGFHEVIGFSAARVDSVFADVQDRLSQTPAAYHPGISPHAPYTVHPELLERLVRLAAQRQLPVAMHLAESREELQLLGENSGPFRDLLEERSMWDRAVFASRRQTLDYLRVLAQAPRVLVIHGNYLSQEEMEFLATQDHMSVVYCPRTHAYFGHSAYPLQELLQHGVRLAIGTDSRASNPDLSLLGELRYMARSFTDLTPQEIVQLGTIEGARALGFEHKVGSLEVGKLANLTAIRCDVASADPLDVLVHSESPVEKTWIRGRTVYSRSS